MNLKESWLYDAIWALILVARFKHRMTVGDCLGVARSIVAAIGNGEIPIKEPK